MLQRGNETKSFKVVSINFKALKLSVMLAGIITALLMTLREGILLIRLAAMLKMLYGLSAIRISPFQRS